MLERDITTAHSLESPKCLASVIWTNIVNRVGIFGWPSNYITMGTTFEYLLDFRRPLAAK